MRKHINFKVIEKRGNRSKILGNRPKVWGNWFLKFKKFLEKSGNES